MKNAKELLAEFTAASFRDPQKAAEMFSEDGAFEMPYLESFGFPGRYEGREALEGFFRFVRELYPDMDLENVKVMNRYVRAGVCRVRVHRAIEQDRTHHPPTLCRPFGRRER